MTLQLTSAAALADFLEYLADHVRNEHVQDLSIQSIDGETRVCVVFKTPPALPESQGGWDEETEPGRPLPKRKQGDSEEPP